MDEMRWDDLKILLAIGRRGSLTAAAQELGIDQTTAGRRLTALESDLGATLFTRSKAGFAPTDAGEVALYHAAQLRDQALVLADAVGSPTLGATGVVRLVGNAWTLDQLTQHSAAGFLRDNPKLRLRIVTLAPKQAIRGETTLSLWFERPKADGEISIDLGSVPYAVYQKKGLAADHSDWVSFYDEDFGRPAITNALARLKKPNEETRYTATDATLLLSAVRAGIGRGLLPKCLAQNDPSLEQVLTDKPDFSRMLRLHMHPESMETKRMQATVQWIRESFAQAFAARD